MKYLRLLLFCLISSFMLGQGVTPNLQLQLPANGTQNWNIPINGNFSAIDGFLSGVNPLPVAPKSKGYTLLNNFPISGTETGGTVDSVFIPLNNTNDTLLLYKSGNILHISNFGLNDVVQISDTGLAVQSGKTLTASGGSLSGMTITGGTLNNATINNSTFNGSLSGSFSGLTLTGGVGTSISGYPTLDFSAATSFKLPTTATVATTNPWTFQFANPAAPRLIQVVDPGGTTTMALLSGSFTNGHCLTSDGTKIYDNGTCAAGSNPDPGINYCYNFPSIQACHDALPGSAGMMVLPFGTTTTCNLTISKSVLMVGQGRESGGSTLNCNVANQPVMTVTAPAAHLAHFAVTHSVLPTTCPGGPTTATCGEGIVVSPNSFKMVIEDVRTEKNWNGMDLGNTSWGQIINSYTANNDNDGGYFNFANGGTAMQWQIYGTTSQQNQLHGWEATNTTANHQVTCPRWYNSPTFGNGGDGWHISASGGSPANGIANCSWTASYGSTNNGNNITMDGGSGARNYSVIGSAGMGYEQAGLTANGIGSQGTPATPNCSAGSCVANTGMGIYITNNNDNANLPDIYLTGVEAYSNGACGVRSENNKTIITGGTFVNNGQDQNSDTTSCGVSLGGSGDVVTGALFEGSSQLIGIELHGSATDAQIAGNSISNATRVKQNVALTSGFKLDSPITVIPSSVGGGTAANNITLLNAQGPVSAITGNGSAQVMYTYSLPASTVATLKGIRVSAAWLHTGSASVAYNMTLNGQAIASASNTCAGGSQAWQISVLNTAAATGVTHSMFGCGSAPQSGSAVISSGLAWSSAQTLQITFSVANTDSVTPEYWTVELLQ